MTTELRLSISPDELTEIVCSVFASMLNLEVYRCSKPWFSGEARLTAAVEMEGYWKGAVLVECDRSLACCFAGHYLSIDPPESVDELVRDVFGELANMIGGNVKSAFTHGIHLSMPWVIDGTSLSESGIELQEKLCFSCPEGIFWVTILISPI